MKKLVAGIALAAGLVAGATALALAAGLVAGATALAPAAGAAPAISGTPGVSKPYAGHHPLCSGQPDGSNCWTYDSGTTTHLNLL